MGVVSDLIPFAKEILSHRPCRGMLKVYLMGSILVLLGAAGGLLETFLLPFLEGRPQKEDSEPDFLLMATIRQKQQQRVKSA
ncbi:unnamed protein product [Arctogadus glacialis]